MSSILTGFPKLVSLKAKACKILFGPIKPTSASVSMAYKGQSNFRITAIFYTNQASKTLFGTNPSVRMAFKDQNSFGKPVLLLTVQGFGQDFEIGVQNGRFYPFCVIIVSSFYLFYSQCCKQISRLW